MSTSLDPQDGRRAVLRDALVRLEEMRSRLQEVERARSEPIAIIGMGCRFPGGAGDPEAFWTLLRDGVDAVSEVPGDRWNLAAHYDADPEAPGKMYSRFGAFLDGLDRFDAAFFGIAPREAARMDPQHRLLLEVAWEALESAGQVPERLAGTRTGVFVGITSSDYGHLLNRAGTDGIGAYDLTGNCLNFAAGRLAYVFGFQGPAFAVDSACSSSLVAVHLACQSLRSRDCRVALAGGVNAILSPHVSIWTSKARMLSPDGRCKTFDAGADGYVRGEGCGVVVLKRLSDAVADGDPIQALIRGSAVNQDGRSSGLTVPNKLAQEAVIREALDRAGVRPADVDYIEAHGTGTALGDPIEVRALAEVLKEGRPSDRPFLLGSVKTNIGHLESAAGVAGLIKVVLALRKEEIPPHLHLKERNPYVAWEEVPAVIPTRRTPWPVGPRSRTAGVSSFGASGTNAHIVLEEAPVLSAALAVERPLHLLTLSAKSETALAELAARFEAHFTANPEASLPDACFTANAGRTQLTHRMSLLAERAPRVVEQLTAWREGRSPAGVRTGMASASRHKVAFLFTGQGSQYAGMGRELYQTQPTFRKALERCEELLRPHLPLPLLSVLHPREGASSPLDETAYTQPALFALEWALSELWRSWGIEPSAVMGHSVGEYVAACVAGVLSLEDALTLVAARGRLMGSLPAGGGMCAVEASEERVRAEIEAEGDVLSIAAVNGPASVVVSGGEVSLLRMVEWLEGEGIRTRRLQVSHAFHSALMDPILDEFERIASGVSFAVPRIPLVSNLSGREAREEVTSAGYWRRHVREPVRFADGMRTLEERGYRAFVEIGPSPTLLGMGRASVSDEDVLWLPSLRKGREEWQELLTSLATLFTWGADVDWPGFDRDYPRRKVALPTYPFQRQRYWAATTEIDARRPLGAEGGDRSVHPLLGWRLASAMKDVLFQSRIGSRSLPYLADHRIHGAVVLPAAAYLEMGLAAGTEALGPGALALHDLVISEALLLPFDAERSMQVVVCPEGSDDASFQVFSRHEGRVAESEPWRLHAAGRLRRSASATASESEPLESARARCAESVSVDEHYGALREAGADFGPTFRSLIGLWRGRGEALGRVQLPEVGEREGYQIHPALLDGCFQVLGAAIEPVSRGAVSGGAYLPVGVERLQLRARVGGEVWSHARVRPGASADTVVADIRLYDASGQVVADLEGLRLMRATAEALRRAAQPAIGEWLYEVEWRARPLGVETVRERPGRWLLFADAGGLGEALARRWAERGENVVVVVPGTVYEPAAGGRARVDPSRPEDFRRLLRDVGATPLRGVVHLWSLAAPEGETTEALRQAAAIGSGSLLHLVQALEETNGAERPRVWVVTRGAQPVGGPTGVAGMAQAPVWGLARTIAVEHPELRCTCVDVDPVAGPEASETLRAEIAADEQESQVAHRQGSRYVARLVRNASRAPAGPLHQPVELDIAKRGILDELRLRPVSRRAPGKGEVEIHVQAAGLNFRDVLNALGVYEGPAGPLGSECAGHVVAVGEGVTDLRVGQPVVTLSSGPSGAFRTYLTTSAAVVVPKPESVSFAEAATAPVAFLTAEYALRHLAGLRQGERVLIHAATGGVGLAALQVAQRAGAEVFATAGSPEKRAFLESLGVRHRFDSRSLSFAEEVRERTDGEGVDVVLNSLTGEFIPRSLGLLRSGGRFLEIGKAGIWTTEQMAAARPDVAYFAIYLGEEDKVLLRDMLRRLMDDFATGALKPLPIRPFSFREAASAFRFMAQAKHIGKIVLLPEEVGTATVRGDATYLVTGGLGSLGLLVARWLVERGARHLVLAGRQGASEAACGVVADLQRAGARVVTLAVDVASEEEVVRLFAGIEAEMPPLRGIVHAAGVLDDGVIRQQSWGRFEQVLAPKMSGAWNLHRASLGRDLDFFVLFSSAAALLGSAGQGTYAAANAFLDALAHHRRGAGLPALSIDWGPWAEVGMAASLDRSAHARWARQGLRLLPPDHALAALERLLDQPFPQVGVLAADLSKTIAFTPECGRSFFDELGQAAVPAAGPAAARGRELIVQLEQAPAGKRRGAVIAHVKDQLSSVLGLPASSILDPKRGFRDLGLDSLMAIELRNRLQQSVGRTLPATLAFDFPTIDGLAAYLFDEVLSTMLGLPAPSAAVSAPAVTASGATEPIAIIGLGCRFPGGANDGESFWRLLYEGVDAITEVPRERWDVEAHYDADADAPGKTYARHGGFVDGVDQFDAPFFGISPREAAGMDPQQRLLLEVSWEALEGAGQAPDKLSGTATGVFVGISNSDYGRLQSQAARLDAYAGTGNAMSAAAGRLSYVLGLQGPSLSVDTACSSSLVAIHLASQSLRMGECRLALVGGVNLMLSPDSHVMAAKARMLAPDGRCKTFDASADGYVRSEGCGVVVLKRLSDALRDGDRVRAVIRATAVNQDGRSGGLTVPNGPAQEAVIREAVGRAGISAADVSYVEAHGTGTSLGDPIELKALGAVYGVDRKAPLLVGSVKTNVGHLEAAAGVAGLIKTVLALEHGEIPQHLHFERPNPHVSWADLPVEVPTSRRAWAAVNGRRLAGVSSFGFTGTNAHLILEGGPAAPVPVPHVDRPLHVLALSARTAPALGQLVARFERHLAADAQGSLADLSFTAATGRAHFPHRVALIASSNAEARERLAALAAGEKAAGVFRSDADGPGSAEIAFLFTGEGSQYVGMGRELYETQPTYRKALEACEEILRPYLPMPLLSVLHAKEGEASPLHETAYTQPGLFALEWALSELWRSWGVEPSAVMGHSVGEYVAACVAGVFSLEDGLRLVAARSRLMGSLPAGGGMWAAETSEERLRAAVVGSGLSIAAVNGPASVVASGGEADLVRVMGRLEAEGIRTKRLAVSHAFHSAQMDPILDELEEIASGVAFAVPRIPLVSNLSGREVREEPGSGGYWRRHAREAVRFADGMRTLFERGCRAFVEIGPSPTLLGMGRVSVPDEEAVWLPSLRKGRGDWQEVLTSLATLYTRGVEVDWPGFDRDYARRKVALPTYPFQRERHWIEAPAPAPRRRTEKESGVHPLLGRRVGLDQVTSK